MKAVTYKLVNAANKGLLKDELVLKDLVCTVADNIHRKGTGKRYSKSLHDFYEAILIIGGPKLATFVAMNIGGPGLDTVYHWRRQNRVDLKPGPCVENMLQIAGIYRSIMEKQNIGRVPVLFAEDETAIKAVIEYDQKEDTLVGFCGTTVEPHSCMQSVKIVVGNDENSYKRMTDAFTNNKKAGHARVILINPLHPSLPRIPVLLAATCNKFTHEDVKDQWDLIDALYKEHLEDILGPGNGKSSDGDTRRRKLMQAEASSTTGERYQPISKEDGFIYSVRKEKVVGNGNEYVIRGCFDQDTIHQGKS